MKFASFQLIAFDGNVITFTRKGGGRIHVNATGFVGDVDLSRGEKHAWDYVYTKVAPVVYGSVSKGKAGVSVNATNSMVRDLMNEIERLGW